MSGLDEDLAKVLVMKDEAIKVLERRLGDKEQEIQELKRKLHKCQSVLPRAQMIGPRTRRAQGISAEPQSFTSFTELIGEAFRKIPKSDRQENINMFSLLLMHLHTKLTPENESK
ncbi:cGMP-dependent protein kinase 1 [Silurus meridionalis]|uniref:cGMP-dependent protein kinase N-terminal coiled-coil domain-containing protein n=1 Tax=Silurus meridionalis TaxID=175797 RepID=A0A8T0BDW4_SILME|nr:hypothetical protein HF521_020405 [Silurus meridionalis]KAI5103082.1 cGMP-dependent protein kinase 1 [Silurus meridionalis]